jgi:hypothetical protein
LRGGGGGLEISGFAASGAQRLLGRVVN